MITWYINKHTNHVQQQKERMRNERRKCKLMSLFIIPKPSPSSGACLKLFFLLKCILSFVLFFIKPFYIFDQLITNLHSRTSPSSHVHITVLFFISNNFILLPLTFITVIVAAYTIIKKFNEAIKDAEMAISLSPKWAKVLIIIIHHYYFMFHNLI